jgi:hypothetical protein
LFLKCFKNVAAPLRFNALLIESAFGAPATLQARIQAHYTQQGMMFYYY